MESKSHDPVRGWMEGTRDPRGGRQPGWGGASSASAFIPLHCTPSPAQRSVLYWTLTHTGAPGKTHRGNTFTHWVQLTEEAGRGLDSYVTVQMRP